MSERAALYLRVSTSEGKQTEENQRRELRKFAQDEGYKLAGEYFDHESGRKGRLSCVSDQTRRGCCLPLTSLIPLFLREQYSVRWAAKSFSYQRMRLRYGSATSILS